MLASEGHLTAGEGALKVTGWRSPAESDLLLTHDSSIIPVSFVLFVYSLCLSLFLSVPVLFLQSFFVTLSVSPFCPLVQYIML